MPDVSPFCGEIRLFAGNYAPVGWEFCSGQLLSVSEHELLFTLLGTTYGGDGVDTFGLPDLCGRVAIHMGQGAGLSNRVLGETGGQENVTLTTAQMPAHTHAPLANSAGSASSPAGNVFAGSTDLAQFAPDPSTAMAATALASAGGGHPHDNMLPFLGINFIICVDGANPLA